MSLAHASWSPDASTDRPMTLTLRRSNSGASLAMYPSSVVHTGVKSFGCENSTAPGVSYPVVEVDPALGGVHVKIRRSVGDSTVPWSHPLLLFVCDSTGCC